MSGWLHFSRDDSDGARLHAPGLVSALFSDGARLGWADAGGLYALTAEGVSFFPLPDIVGLVVTPTRWVAHTADGLLHWGAPLSPDWSSRALPAEDVTLGSAWLVWRRGLEQGAQTIEGADLPLPHTARQAHPCPDRPGLFWVSAGTLYWMKGDGTVQALDAVPSPVRRLLTGPHHSVLVQLDDGRALSSVGGRLLAQLTDGATIDDGCFDAEGRRALLRTEEGCGLHDLATGERLGTYEGVAPVSLSPLTALLEEDTGELLTPDGDLILGGLAGGPALLSGTLLVGPGSAAWDLETGAERFSGPPLAAEELLASSDTIYCIHDEEVAIIDRETGAELKWLERPEGAPVMADDTLLFVEDAQPEVDLDEGEDAWLEDAGGLPVTAEATVAGRRWLWSDEGLLVSVPASA